MTGLIISVIVILILISRSNRTKIELTQDLINVVHRYVPFIYALDSVDKQRFYKEIVKFINEHDFKGLDTDANFEDKVLVSSCAVMLFFSVGTDYLKSLNTIFISEKAISYDSLPQKASGFLKQYRSGFDLYISRKSLIYGFRNAKDNKNVGVHELAHLLDGLDGNVDGMPQFFLKGNELHDWKNLVQKYDEVIKKGEIDNYALTNKAEFFAVLTEYFFENPFVFKQKHNALYHFFVSIYKIDLVKSFHNNYPKEG